MKLYIFKMKNELLSDVFQSSFESVTYKSKKKCIKEAEDYINWMKENVPHQSRKFDILEVTFTKVKE
jgi:hypothetical protein